MEHPANFMLTGCSRIVPLVTRPSLMLPDCQQGPDQVEELTGQEQGRDNGTLPDHEDSPFIGQGVEKGREVLL
ncbi:MAG TPA: hypothetical protein VHC20_05810 [Candidatus Paceibacterota bacterium]|nr:hypothetical protein [Candidatus Paceibacterota bacterium]